MLPVKSHLQLAEDDLESAAVHFIDAVRTGEFFSYPAPILDKLDLLKRATARVRGDLLARGSQVPFDFLLEPVSQQGVLLYE